MSTGFYQRRNDLMRHMINCKDLTIVQKVVGLKVLLDYMNSSTELAWMSAGRLARELDLHVDTARKALKANERAGFLEGERRRGRTTEFQMGLAYRYHPRPGAGEVQAGQARDPRRQRRGNMRNEYNENLRVGRYRVGGLRNLNGEFSDHRDRMDDDEFDDPDRD